MLGHLNPSHFIVFFASTFAVIANSILILLIAKYSRPEFGRYKYLMMMFATINIIYPLFNLILMPGLHIVGHAFVFFIASPFGAYFNQSTGQFMILFWTMLYDQQLILIVFHFLYRYVAICRINWIPWFKKWTVRFGILAYVLTDISTWSWFMESQSFWLRENRWYIQEDFKKYYGIDAEKAAIFGALFVVWLTIQIYSTLKHARMSARTKRLQMDLLHALIAQTACPFVMEGAPCLMTHLYAFTATHIGPWSSYMFIPVDLYPLLDAFTMIYFIRDYRRVIIAKWRKQKIHSLGSQTNLRKYETSNGSNVKTLQTSMQDVIEKDSKANKE